MQRQWILPASLEPQRLASLQKALNLPDFLLGLLLQKEMCEPEQATEFLAPRLRSLSPPELLAGMHPAVERILLAWERKERIVLYGDYDVDGVASLAFIHRIFAAYGVAVQCFLPLRVEEGYGLSLAGVERCFEETQPELLIAVDCGTNSVPEAREIQKRGADLLIFDHHQPGGERPECRALVNPQLGKDFHYLCSAGVAFKLAHALKKRCPLAALDLREYLDLVALATVCDLVPLVAENRILVRHGLKQLEKTRWKGLAALMEVAGVKPPIRSADMGFRLGPRINAAGRLGTAQQALTLLLSDDGEECVRIAKDLDAQNRDRQAVEKSLVQEVESWVTHFFNPLEGRSIVAGSRDWHSGVLGIVASRIAKRYHRPTFLVGFDAQGTGKGSGRSIEGVSLVELLQQCSPYLEKFGGHAMAAGITVYEGNFQEFQKAFEVASRAGTCVEILTPRLRVDAELGWDDLSEFLLDLQECLEPFGPANPQPIFCLRGVVPFRKPQWMKERHLRLEFSPGRPGRELFQAVFFNAYEVQIPSPPWDVAFHLDRNVFRGRSSLQLKIVDIRSAGRG